MGWSGGTEIFDIVVWSVLSDCSKEEVISNLIEVLEDHDWDNQDESGFWNNPIVNKIFKDKYPDWFEDDE